MRIDRATWAMEIARVTAKRSTCLRRHVGCVLLDVDGYILSTGVNGVAKGEPHCNAATQHISFRCDGGTKLDPKFYPHACPGATAASGTNLDGCHAIHAEQNALLRCPDVRLIHTCFTTTSPCLTCVKLLMNTACEVIMFDDVYPHTASQELWEHHGGSWVPYKEVTA